MPGERGKIRVGTCSWQEPTLIDSGGFYPRGMEKAEMISYYADRFDVVEVDSSYYRFIPPSVFAKWAERTSDAFLFNVKAPGIFTGQGIPPNGLPREIFKELDEEQRNKSRLYIDKIPEELADDLWSYFRSSLDPLREAGRLGWLLFQFPPYFHYGPNRQEYLLECKRRLSEDVVAVEFRAQSWFRDPKTGEERSEETLTFLEDNKLAFVAVDEPQGFASSVPPVFAVTHPRYAVVRFHGRNTETWEKKGISTSERFNHWYSDEELGEWIPPIMGASDQGTEVHVQFNTNNGLQGPINSLRMKKALGQITEEKFNEIVAAYHAPERERAVLRPRRK